jgi:hypothetical protein
MYNWEETRYVITLIVRERVMKMKMLFAILGGCGSEAV